MESYTDQEIEDMLMHTGKAMQPDPARLQAVLDDPTLQRADSKLSPLSIMFIMNTASKVLMAFVAVVVVAGAGVYMSKSSRTGTPVDNNGAVLPQSGDTQTQGTTGSAQPGNTSPSTSLAVADAVIASLQSGLDAQTSGVGSLDQSASQSVTSVDTANSSKQPYDEKAI